MLTRGASTHRIDSWSDPGRLQNHQPALLGQCFPHRRAFFFDGREDDRGFLEVDIFGKHHEELVASDDGGSVTVTLLRSQLVEQDALLSDLAPVTGSVFDDRKIICDQV